MTATLDFPVTRQRPVPRILDYQLHGVKQTLSDLGWTDRTLQYLPATIRRSLGLLAAAEVTPDEWQDWRWRFRKPQVSVLVAAWRAGYDKHEALRWATGHGKVSARLEEIAFAGPFELTYEQCLNLRFRWTSNGRNRYGDLAGLAAWYSTHVAANIPLDISVLWHPDTPIWVLRWAATGQVSEIPNHDQVPLAEETVWDTAEIIDRFPDLPLEVLAWVASERGGRLDTARAHADAFDGVDSAAEWVRVQALKQPRARHIFTDV